jgi:hypothetical protein
MRERDELAVFNARRKKCRATSARQKAVREEDMAPDSFSDLYSQTRIFRR